MLAEIASSFRPRPESLLAVRRVARADFFNVLTISNSSSTAKAASEQPIVSGTMPSREVLATYTLYPSGNADLHTALAGLRAQFPLHNLHWKSSTRTALRTIQEADVSLVDLGDVPPPKDLVAGSVLDTPLVNVCFVSCDVGLGDAAALTGTGRRCIQEPDAYFHQGLAGAPAVTAKRSHPSHCACQLAVCDWGSSLVQECVRT